MSAYYINQIIDDQGVPRYVGKGKGDRCREHLRLAQRLATGGRASGASYVHVRMAKAMRAGRSFSATIIEADLTEAAAYRREVELIAALGCEHAKTGPLWNLLPGGREIDLDQLAEAMRYSLAACGIGGGLGWDEDFPPIE
jgi:hypothetical protein